MTIFKSSWLFFEGYLENTCQFSMQSENIPVFLFQLREIYAFLSVCIEITNSSQNCATFLFNIGLDYLQLSITQTFSSIDRGISVHLKYGHENRRFSCRA